MKKIKVGAVSYKNTKPLLYGIKRSGLMEKIELIEDYPSNIATQLLNNQIDIGLVPVAIIPKLQEAYIVSNYCIGATEPVTSVCLFSEVELDKIETVLLDYQSKTSVNLCKILLKNYWKKEVIFLDAGADFRNEIKGTTAGVVIGDRALEQQKISLFVYDLAEEWIAFTGLPFVFAAWVSNKVLPKDFVDEFNAANAFGLQHIDEVVAENPFSLYDLKKYYTQNISYLLDEEKKKGLKLFLDYLSEL
ncbi:MAG TPA: menaquinone biosynthesis protein [Chitinophagaceae bacterium]|nr:menaquinone biosynthesis protein [Chitinophagaceae bacterium]MBP9739834.1 menaquinone biosynthesis protein [Chitinophagaceae bacterium]HPH22640.1 menaquinone biosynthesis protein [Chitinophagaceae bacterium]